MPVIIGLDVIEQAGLTERFGNRIAPLRRHLDDAQPQLGDVAPFHGPMDAQGLADPALIDRIPITDQQPSRNALRRRGGDQRHRSNQKDAGKANSARQAQGSPISLRQGSPEAKFFERYAWSEQEPAGKNKNVRKITSAVPYTNIPVNGRGSQPFQTKSTEYNGSGGAIEYRQQLSVRKMTHVDPPFSTAIGGEYRCGSEPGYFKIETVTTSNDKTFFDSTVLQLQIYAPSCRPCL